MLTIISFIIVLGVLVFVHELGHYLAARHVGVKVLSFSIGFPPKLWGKTIGETEYMISWVPLGGYVKLHGQNMDDENPQDPTNYAAKTRLQRFYILIAGPAMNLIAALLVMPLVYWIGVDMPQYLQNPAQLYKVKDQSFAQQLGFQSGDLIVELNEQPIQTWEDLHTQLGELKEGALSLKVSREGHEFTIQTTTEELKRQGELGWSPLVTPIIGSFAEKSPAKAAGLQTGDVILSLDGQAITEWGQISEVVQKLQGWSMPVIQAKGSALPPVPQPKPIAVEVKRGEQTQAFQVTPVYNASSKTFILGMTTQTYRKAYSFPQSLVMGTERLWFLTHTTFSFLGKMLRGQGSLNDLGGPIKIGLVVGEAVRSGITDLLFLVAFISLQLGIFNLLPIPVLDGGHIFFLGLEKLKGKPLSTGFRERTQMIGFSLLLLLMLVVTYNDLLQLL